MAHDVFISYSTNDKPIADAICANLEGVGVRCWIAPRDIMPGDDWPAVITNAIEQSRVMVLIFSASSNSSEDVGRELMLAASCKLVIVPFKIEDVEPEPGKRYYLARTHWLDAVNPPTRAQIDRLVETVKFLVVKAGGAAETKAKPQVASGVQVRPAVEDSLTGQGMPVTAEPVPVASAPLVALTARKRHTGLWIAGALVGIMLFGFIGGLVWRQRANLALPYHQLATPTPTTTPALAPTPIPSETFTRTSNPTATVTPAPAWVTGFAEPILATIASHPPNFEDDFSVLDGSFVRWGNNPGTTFGEGVMHLHTTDGSASAWGTGISASDFVIEFEFTPVTISVGSVIFNFRFGENKFYSIDFSRVSQGGLWTISYNTNSEYHVIAEDHSDQIWRGRKTTVRLIVRGDEIALYLNGQPVGYGRYAAQQTYTWNAFLANSFNAPIDVVIDNVKFWDLDNLKP